MQRCYAVYTRWFLGLLGVILVLGMVASQAAAESATDYMQTLGLMAFEQKIPAPDFTVKTITGDTVRLSDLKGRVVLLNFWATW